MKIWERLTSHGALAGEAGADIDDEYISRTAQHQPPPASQLYNSHAKEEGETVEGYNKQPANTNSRNNKWGSDLSPCW